jgi:hypothetical protein
MGVLFETTNTVQPTVQAPLGGIVMIPMQNEADGLWNRIQAEVNQESARIRMEVILSGMRGRIQEMVANTNWDDDSDDEPASQWGSDNEDD